MEWEEFNPVFFEEKDDAGERDLAILNTLGWKAQAQLAGQGIGFIQMGTERYMISTHAGAQAVAQRSWKK